MPPCLRSLTAAIAMLLPVLAAAFPDAPPNDPGWDTQYNFRGDNVGIDTPNPSAEFPLATDAAGSSGMSADVAWREGQEAFGEAALGRPDVVMAYMEGGINWHLGSGVDSDPFQTLIVDILPNIYIDRDEVRGSPAFAQCRPDDPGKPVYRVSDFAHCVPDSNGNGIVDAEDVIVFFQDGVDHSGSGYADDISGFDFYNRQPNPATVDSEQGHANTQIQKGVAVANNSIGLAGLCPRCRTVPVKLAAESLGRSNEIAEAIIYTTDMGAHGYVSETADLGYSSFMRQAMAHHWRAEWEYTDTHGVTHSVQGIPGAMTSNNFNSTDHQGSMFWPHVLPCNSIVADTAGLAGVNDVLPPNALATTFRRKSSNNSWGTRYWVALSTRAGTTSETCGTALGVLGLMQSWSLEATDRRYIDAPLSASEVMQILARSADPIGPGDDVGWPVREGWDRFTGYGRVNLRRAQQMIADGDVPPRVWFDSPRWFALFDPTRGGEIVIEGHISAPRAAGFSWELQWALGAEPDESDFQTIASGNNARDGEIGRLPLSAIPESFFRAAFQADNNRDEAVKDLPSTEQYTVTFRIQAVDNRGLLGEERRTVFAQHDPDWLPGFPIDTGSAGVEAGVVLADLQGRGRMSLVYADMDGVVHAVDARTRQPVPGWPVTTDRTSTLRDMAALGIDPGSEPVVNPIAIGDLDGDGRISVVVTSTTGKTYVWNENGQRRVGWPRALNVGVAKPASPRPPVAFSRPPIQGAFSSPVLDDLTGDGRLEVIQAGWDGNLHVWNADGDYLPGWPVAVSVPDSTPIPPGYSRFQDLKLSTTPVIADITGDGRKNIVLRSQMTDALGSGEAPLALGHAVAYDDEGRMLPGWPVKMLSVLVVHGTSQEFITEGASSPVAADFTGDGTYEVAINPGFAAATYVYNGNGLLTRAYGPVPTNLEDLLQFPVGVGLGGLPTAGGILGQLTGVIDNLFAPATDPLVELPLLGDVVDGLLDSVINLPSGIGSLPDLAIGFTTSGAFGRFGATDTLSFAQPGSNTVSALLSLLPAGFGAQIINSDRAYDARTSVPLPGFPVTGQGLNFLGSPVIADVTGDGQREIITGGDSSAIQAWTDLGQIADGFAKFTTGWTLWAPTIGDADGDGRVEVIEGTREGYVMAWKTPGRAEANTEWWRFRANEWNNGRYGSDTRPPGILRELSARPAERALRFIAPGDNWYTGRVVEYVLSAVDGGELQRLAATVDAGEPEQLTLPEGIERGFIQAVDAAGNRSRKQGFALSGAAPNPPPGAPTQVSGGGGGGAFGLVVLLALLGMYFGRFALRRARETTYASRAKA